VVDVEVEALAKTFKTRPVTVALDSFSLWVPSGEMLVLLGSSGSGKTTALRCLAGLEKPDAGTIRIGERMIVDHKAKIDVPAHRRGLGLVFQSFALWPHLTAGKNIEYPLKCARVARATRRQAVSEIARLVDLNDELLNKRPGQLSGGQQQRVALARALVSESKVILFDEPLSNLDAQLREQLRGELRTLHDRLQFTGVYVTHDLAEALALGQRVAVMQSGSIMQTGTPSEVFRNPQSVGVALLLGYKRTALLRRNALSWTWDHGKISGCIPTPTPSYAEIEVLARSDRLRLLPADASRSPGAEADLVLEGGVIDSMTATDQRVEAIIAFGPHRVLVRLPDEGDASWRSGQPVSVTIPARHLACFDAEGQRVHTEAIMAHTAP
jgi:iron(III) transport system ATP-binding protein